MIAVGDVVGGMRIDAVAGRGGMGVVYRARELALDRDVALKVVHDDVAQDDEFRERFRREARLAASIDHPHVVPVLHAGEADGHLYLAMQYVVGTDLAALIGQTGRLDPGDAVGIVGQVADALDAAHARGLVHRDVKPANILSTGPVGRPYAYLTDFGISKDGRDAGLTRTGHVVGSLNWIAPEQLEGGPVDGRADLYSLACVLHQALTGQVLFPRDSTAARLYAHLHAAPPTPGSVVPELGGPLDAVLTRALAKRPEDRFATAGEFAAAARDAVVALPAPPPPELPAPVSGPGGLVPPPLHGGPVGRPVHGQTPGHESPGQQPPGQPAPGQPAPGQPAPGQPCTSPAGRAAPRWTPRRTPHR